jgi:hypothetical protein
MARLFNVEVFNQVISGAATGAPNYFSKPEFNALLGSADILVVMVMLDMVQSTGTVVDVAFEPANVNEEAAFGGGPSFKVPSSDTAGPTNVPFSVPFSISVFDTQSTTSGGVTSTVSAPKIGAFGRFKVSSSPDTAAVRIIVAGYG